MVEIGSAYYEGLQEIIKLYSQGNYGIIYFEKEGYALGASGGICYLCRDRCEEGDLFFEIDEPVMKIRGLSFNRKIYYTHKQCIKIAEKKKVLTKVLNPVLV